MCQESAGEDLTAGIPPVRVLDRAGVHAPVAAAGGAPERVHGPDLSVYPDVEDVGVAIREEDTGFAVGLLGEQVPEVDKLGFGLVTKLGEDGSIHGCLRELVDAKFGLRDILLHLLEEGVFEVVANIADLHLRGGGGVNFEVVATELLEGGSGNGGEGFEKLRNFALH